MGDISPCLSSFSIHAKVKPVTPLGMSIVVMSFGPKIATKQNWGIKFLSIHMQAHHKQRAVVNLYISLCLVTEVIWKMNTWIYFGRIIIIIWGEMYFWNSDPKRKGTYFLYCSLPPGGALASTLGALLLLVYSLWPSIRQNFNIFAVVGNKHRNVSRSRIWIRMGHIQVMC